MDQQIPLLVELSPAMLKTIAASAVSRQSRMAKVAQEGRDNNDYTFVDAAITEGEKAYELGRWAESHLQSLSPDRIDAEWSTDGYGRLFRVKDAEFRWEVKREAEETAVPEET